MIHFLFYRFSSFWRSLFYYLIVGLIFSGIIFFLFNKTAVYLDARFGIEFDFIHFFLSDWRLIVGCLIVLFFPFGFSYLGHRFTVRKFNSAVKDVLDDKGIGNNFENLYSAKSFFQCLRNLNSLLGMLKSFDVLKSSRFVLEVNTSRMLMNNINEGVLLVNKDKVVTNINPTGESLLKLIPGEIVGQIISRKISYSTLLDGLDLALKDQLNVDDKELTLTDKTKLNMTILPVKNRLGEFVRVIIVLKPNI